MGQQTKLFHFKEETAIRDIVFIPLFLSLYLVYHFFQDINFQLELFNGRPISTATSEAIDISKRVSSFYRGFIAFTIFCLSFTYLIFRARPFLNFQDLQLLNAVSSAGVVLFFFQILGAELLPSIHLSLAILIVVIFGAVFRSKWNFRNNDTFYLSLIVWIISLSFSLYFLQVQIFNFLGIVRPQSLPVFICVFSSVLLLYYFLLQRTQEFNSNTVKGFIFITAPLAFLPLLSIVATELYMILNQHDIYVPGNRIIYFSLLLLLLVWMAFRNIQWKKNLAKTDTGSFQTLARVWFPAIAAGIAALATYRPIVPVNIDWFEDANRILPLQQWFDFGKIPFLDTFSSHAFSDFGPGILFSLLNGSNALGGFVYQFIVPVLVTIVLYYFVFRITQNGLIALFVVLFYPYSDFILPSYYNLIPLTILALLNIYRKQNTGNYIIFFLVLVLMIVWRIDLGSANLIAGIGGLLILCLATPNFTPDKSSLLKGLAVVVSGALTAFILVSIFYSGNIFSRLSEALGYMSSFQSYGLKDLSAVKNIEYYSLYFVLPFAVLLTAAYSFIKLRKNGDHQKSQSYLALSILFLSLFFFANFQRGLVRHTLAEQWDTALTSYGYFILTVGVFFNSRFKNNKTILFFIFITLSTLIVVNYKFSEPVLSKNNMYFSAKQEMHNAMTVRSLGMKVNRTPESPDIASTYHELDAFLKNNFPDSSTFLDFSNSPMLYYYLHRTTPNYLCQIPHTAHNEKMQKFLLDGLSEYDIPVVVFSHVPGNFWDNLDGIPNSLRHYRISEYIYKHYQPFGILNSHSIWLRKDIKLKESPSRLLMNHTSLNSLVINGGTQIDSTTILGNPDAAIRIKNFNSAPIKLSNSFRYYFTFKLISGAQTNFSIFNTYSGPQGTETRKADLRVVAGHSEPFYILEKKQDEEFLQSTEILLPPGIDFSFSSVQFIECEKLPDLYSSQIQEHNLKFIPYVWANFDNENTNEDKANELMLLDQNHPLEANHEIRFRVKRIPDKQHGNYIHLKARATGTNPANVILNYGYQNKKSGGVIFTILNSETVNEYKIRISSQYNWYKDDIEWISVYSIGENLELRLIEIEKGD